MEVQLTTLFHCYRTRKPGDLHGENNSAIDKEDVELKSYQHTGFSPHVSITTGNVGQLRLRSNDVDNSL